LKWFVASVLAVSSRHDGRRTKMLVGHSLSRYNEGNLVDLEWRSADCGAPWRRLPVHMCYCTEPILVIFQKLFLLN